MRTELELEDGGTIIEIERTDDGLDNDMVSIFLEFSERYVSLTYSEAEILIKMLRDVTVNFKPRVIK